MIALLLLFRLKMTLWHSGQNSKDQFRWCRIVGCRVAQWSKIVPKWPKTPKSNPLCNHYLVKATNKSMLLYNWLYKKESMSNVSNTNYGLIYCTYHLMLSYNTFMSSPKTLVVYLQWRHQKPKKRPSILILKWDFLLFLASVR